MVASNIIRGNGLTKKINMLCLLAAMVTILVLPVKKEVWYDETVSMLCSKGISHDSPVLFANTNTISSATLEQLNTSQNVFNATVIDNANGFLYNYGLHWFTLLFGNSITVYMLFSKLCAIAALIAFYALCMLFFENSLFTSVAVLLLVTDLNFIGMSHEIRAYSMGIFFVTLASVYLFRFLYQKETPFYLFLTGLFSVAAILSHFLSVYIILVFVMALLFTKRVALFTARNMLAMLFPIALIVLFFYFSSAGLHHIGIQNKAIQEASLSKGFSLWEVLLRSLRFTAINFKLVFPAFWNNIAVVIISFCFVITLNLAGIKATVNKIEKRNLRLLLTLGASSSLFLILLSIISHHYTSLYYRYYSFGTPFSCLFTAYVLYICYNSVKVSNLIKGGLPVIIIAPTCLLFFVGIIEVYPPLKYNHIAIAAEIVNNKIGKIEVPGWRDAFLVQSVLPQGYKIDYFRNPETPYFVLYKSTGVENIPVIKDDQ